MDSRFKMPLAYPEMLTHGTVRLSAAPGENDLPETGHVYQWESVEGGVPYINLKFSDGFMKSYPLNQQVTEAIEVVNSQTADLEFTAADLEEGVLRLDNSFPIADILLNQADGSAAPVSVPIRIEGDRQQIDFGEIDESEYALGGKVRYTHGVVVLTQEDSIYHIPVASGTYRFNARNGYTQIISRLEGNIAINSGSVANLPDDKLLKVMVMDRGYYGATVNGVRVPYKSFFVAFLGRGGSAVWVGNPVEIGDERRNTEDFEDSSSGGGYIGLPDGWSESGSSGSGAMESNSSSSGAIEEPGTTDESGSSSSGAIPLDESNSSGSGATDESDESSSSGATESNSSSSGAAEQPEPETP